MARRREIQKALLNRDEARSLTDEVKMDAERLWRKLVELYEGGAHEVLGYSSWGAYFKAEFGGSERRAYELLNAGRVLDSVRHGALSRAPNERQARELAPLLGQPEVMREAWERANEGDEPVTAAKVRDAVREVTERPILEARIVRPNLKQAARNVIQTAVREGRGYTVSVGAMEELMRAIGEF